MKVLSAPRVDYRFIRRVNPSSTFIPSITRDKYEVANSKQGVIAEIINDGIEASFAFCMCVSVYECVHVCRSVPSSRSLMVGGVYVYVCVFVHVCMCVRAL